MYPMQQKNAYIQKRSLYQTEADCVENRKISPRGSRAALSSFWSGEERAELPRQYVGYVGGQELFMAGGWDGNGAGYV